MTSAIETAEPTSATTAVEPAVDNVTEPNAATDATEVVPAVDGSHPATDLMLNVPVGEEGAAPHGMPVDGIAPAMTAEVGHAPAEGPKMPQLNTEHFSSQIFWLLVTFIALYAMLSRSLLPRVHDVMEGRQSKIAHDMDRAEQLRTEAEEAKVIYEKALQESRAKAQNLMAESAALVEKAATSRQAELDSKLERQLAEADANIQTAKAQALARLAPVSKELTQQIIEQLTGEKSSAGKVSETVDKLIKQKEAA